MAKNPLTINQDDNESLSLVFSKEKLNEFIFSLLATPRQERRVFKGGFDLTLEDTKSIVDQILHKINTDHDLIHKDFKAEILLENDTRISLNSYEQLFSISDYRDECIKELSITLSVTIPFNREENEKSFEKQTIALIFIGGSDGTIEAEIRSTEITWPAGYFSLISKNCQKLAKDVQPSLSNRWNFFFFLHPILMEEVKVDENNSFSAEKARISLLVTFTMILVLMGLLIGNALKIPTEAAIYNQETQLIEKKHVPVLFKKLGWEKTASMLRDTQIISRLDWIKFEDDFGPRTPLTILFDGFSLKWFFGIGLGLFVLVLSNYWYARALQASLVGRIFLYTDNPPPRPQVNILSGILGSLFIGVTGSIIATSFLNLWNLL